MKPARIRLRINQLTLHGVAPQDRAALETAFRSELARALGANPPNMSRTVRAATVSAAPAAGGTAAGQAAAAAVGRAVGGEGR